MKQEMAAMNVASIVAMVLSAGLIVGLIWAAVHFYG